MANHGYITFRKKINGDKLATLLEEINQKRFGGHIKISRNNKGWDGKPTFGVETFHGLERIFFLPKPRKIEHRHGGGGNFPWWIDSVFSNDLALALNGTISDDGVSDKWKGEVNIYPTFEDYEHMSWGLDRPDRQAREQCLEFVENEIKEVEKERPDLKPYLWRVLK